MSERLASYCRSLAQLCRALAKTSVEAGEKRRALNQAIGAFERASRARKVTARQIRPLVVAAKSPSTRVWESAISLLVALAGKHEAVRNAMREMLNSAKVNERFNVVAALEPSVPESLSMEIIRQALNDRSPRVREKAAEAADRLFLGELRPDLEKSLASESHRGAKRALEFHVAMLRDGYILERLEDGTPSLVVRHSEGWAFPTVTEKDVDKKRLKRTVARVRAYHDRQK